MPKFVVLALLCGLAPVPAPAQAPDLAAGNFLVSGRGLGDPNFSETVILLLRYDEEEGAMGVVINRRSDLPLSRVFQDLKQAKGRTDLAYVGGPVEPGDVLALLKSSTNGGTACLKRCAAGSELLMRRRSVPEPTKQNPSGRWRQSIAEHRGRRSRPRGGNDAAADRGGRGILAPARTPRANPTHRRTRREMAAAPAQRPGAGTWICHDAARRHAAT